jgi:acetolactate synthase-1/2/3 large subunit
VLVDVPKDIQQQLIVPNWDVELRLGGYLSRLSPQLPGEAALQQVCSIP